jgi:hypothetical protein
MDAVVLRFDMHRIEQLTAIFIGAFEMHDSPPVEGMPVYSANITARCHGAQRVQYQVARPFFVRGERTTAH